MPKGSNFARQASTADPSPTVLAACNGWSDIAPVGGRRRRGVPVDRPEYRVPLMSEIAEQPRNGLTVATTFAGGGGSSTGYEMAGYRVVWASEFEPHAVSTYRANHPSTLVDDRDIRTVTADEVLEACGGPPDLFDGSPPCQSFSMAGKRSKGWGESIKHADGTEQRADDLFDEYIRLVRGIQPRAFVAENVAGLVSGVSKGQFKQIMRDLTACGYVVRARVLDAQWLGVPQRRRRVIIIGLRDDLGFTDVPYPTPFPYRYSMLDACPWLGGSAEMALRQHGTFKIPESIRAADSPPVTVTAGGSGDIFFRGGGFSDDVQSIDEPSPSIYVSGHGTGRWSVHRGAGVLRKRPSSATNPDMDYDVATEPAPAVTTKGSMDHWRVAHVGSDFYGESPADEPSRTVMASGSGTSEVGVRFGAESRKLTIAELKRICSFPDDYILEGPYNQQWARLGNSVPPLMARAVASTLAPLLLGAS